MVDAYSRRLWQIFIVDIMVDVMVDTEPHAELW